MINGVLLGAIYAILIFIFCRIGDVVDELKELNRNFKEQGG